MINELLKKKFFTVLVVVLVIIGLFATLGKILPAGKDGKPNFFANAVGMVVSPFQGSFSWAINNIGDAAGYFVDNKIAAEQNDKLKKRVTVLENQLDQTEKYRIENIRLTELLELKKQNSGYDPVCAEVISREAENWSGLIKLNKGSADGIEMNNIVVETAGLVGYVSEVGVNWCTVTTIIAPDSGISCILPRTGEIVMLEGSMEGSAEGRYKLSYIPEDSTITHGEAIETSGEGGIYPKGFLVGRIENIYDGKNGISKEADGKAAVDFKRLREVLVLKIK